MIATTDSTSLLLEDVSLTIGNKRVLADITWKVETGEHWVLFGRNGSGKTTLLRVINGYLWPSTGKVSVLGSLFGRVDLRELRKAIGTVGSYLREQFYPGETAAEIVLSGLYASIGLYEKPDAASWEKAHRIMAELNCLELADQPYRTLSQGEKQITLIARALVNSPRLLLLDEPCLSLDVFAREQLLQLLAQVAENRPELTMIYVTHYAEEIIPMFDRAVLLHNGRIHSCGDTGSVFTSENLTKIFGCPVRTRWDGNRISLSLTPDRATKDEN